MSVSALTVAGSRTSGTPIRTQNVMAANAIANIVKSSLGPVGLDKMLVDDIGVSKNICFNTSETFCEKLMFMVLGCHSNQRRCYYSEVIGCRTSSCSSPC